MTLRFFFFFNIAVSNIECIKFCSLKQKKAYYVFLTFLLENYEETRFDTKPLLSRANEAHNFFNLLANYNTNILSDTICNIIFSF